MLKRSFHFILALLILMAFVVVPIANFALASVEKNESKWTLVEFTWEEETSGNNTRKHVEYALVGPGNGEDAFKELAPYHTVYRYRFSNLLNQLKKQSIQQSEDIFMIQIQGEPTEISFKTDMKTEGDKETSFTSVVFNGTEVANLEGDTAFIFVSWSLEDYTAKPEQGEAEMYLYHPDGCMDGAGAKRELCPSCGLITVHEVLFCGHRSCIKAEHKAAACGYSGHLACRGDHGKAECGTSGHYVCVGDHEIADCGIEGHNVCDDEDHGASACGLAGHTVCDGKTHICCPGCTTLRCSSYYVAANHALASCGHYLCQAGTHEQAECGHYQCIDYVEAEHAKAGCGHYLCQEGAHEQAECGHYLCIDYVAEEHKELDCGHYACETDENGDLLIHNQAPCGHYECVEGYVAANHCVEAPCGHYTCVDGFVAEEHEQIGCGHYECNVSEGTKEAHEAPCGHFYCEAGTHEQAPCGHYQCIDYVAEEHEHIDCGHYECNVGSKEVHKLPCGHFVCQDIPDHSACACGLYVCITHECPVAGTP